MLQVLAFASRLLAFRFLFARVSRARRLSFARIPCGAVSNGDLMGFAFAMCGGTRPWQVGISALEREQDYHKCLTELRTLALKINSECAPSPDRPVLVLQVMNGAMAMSHQYPRGTLVLQIVCSLCFFFSFVKA